MEIQTIHNIKLQITKLIKFVRNSDNGAGLAKHKSVTQSSHEEVNAVLQWFNQEQRQAHQFLVPCVRSKPFFFLEAFEI